MKFMNRTGKIARPPVRHQAYRSAFERLDEALAVNARSHSNDIAKIDRLRLAVFGCLPETVKPPKKNHGPQRKNSPAAAQNPR
jgi:hypothetical protein